MCESLKMRALNMNDVNPENSHGSKYKPWSFIYILGIITGGKNG